VGRYFIIDTETHTRTLASRAVEAGRALRECFLEGLFHGGRIKSAIPMVEFSMKSPQVRVFVITDRGFMEIGSLAIFIPWADLVLGAFNALATFFPVSARDPHFLQHLPEIRLSLLIV